MDLHIGDTAVSSVKSKGNTSEGSLIPDELEEPAEQIILLDKSGAIYLANKSDKYRAFKAQIEHQKQDQLLEQQRSVVDQKTSSSGL